MHQASDLRVKGKGEQAEQRLDVSKDVYLSGGSATLNTLFSAVKEAGKPEAGNQKDTPSIDIDTSPKAGG